MKKIFPAVLLLSSLTSPSFAEDVASLTPNSETPVIDTVIETMGTESIVNSESIDNDTELNQIEEHIKKDDIYKTFDTPYIKSLQQKGNAYILNQIKNNKDETMKQLKNIQRYTDEEYNQLYQNYENNPPYIIQDGQLSLNPDYISKNTPFIEKDGEYIENPDYKEIPLTEEEQNTVQSLQKNMQQEKKLGKKYIPVNPDAF